MVSLQTFTIPQEYLDNSKLMSRPATCSTCNEIFQWHQDIDHCPSAEATPNIACARKILAYVQKNTKMNFSAYFPEETPTLEGFTSHLKAYIENNNVERGSSIDDDDIPLLTDVESGNPLKTRTEQHKNLKKVLCCCFTIIAAAITTAVAIPITDSSN